MCVFACLCVSVGLSCGQNIGLVMVKYGELWWDEDGTHKGKAELEWGGVMEEKEETRGRGVGREKEEE